MPYSSIRIERGCKKGVSIGKGFSALGSRITTSANRCVLFNILLNRFYVNFLNKKCLDLCCGSGIVGFEMLSLNASSCVFIDCDISKLKNIVIGNEKLTFDIQTIRSFLPNLSQNIGEFDIIFFDPPYQNDFCDKTIKFISINNILSKNGIFIIETMKDIDISCFKLLYKKDLKNGAKFYFLCNHNNDNF